VRCAVFRIEMPCFAGPLELLLQLIERKELDITAVSLALVADQFLAHVRAAEPVNPDDLADFLVVGARLVWIKSVALLPRPSPIQREEVKEEADDLARRLIEYRTFRQAALSLGEREAESLRCYPRESLPTPSQPAPLQPVALNELLRALQRALLCRERPSTEVLPDHRCRVEDKIQLIRQWLRSAERLSFARLLGLTSSRDEVIATFLALLELIKARQLEVEQACPYGEITIVPASAGSIAVER